MKLLTFYSDTHEELYKEFFFKSYNKFLKDDFELVPLKVEQISKSGDYGSKGFEETMLYKINHILSNLNNTNEIIVFADCDIHFFKSFKDDIKIHLSDKDIVFQNDVACVCAGFMGIKDNENSINFLTEVRKTLKDKMNNNSNNYMDDQIIINNLLPKYKGLKWGKLPNNYFTVVMSTGTKRWDGKPFNVPSNIFLHHANWTIGLENKFKMMGYVKKELTNGN